MLHADQDARLRMTADLLRALGEPSRLELLDHLSLGPHRVVDLVQHLGLAQSTVSQHLSCLRACGLVDSRPRGRASEFFLVEGVPVAAVLEAVGLVLDVTGGAVAGCRTATPPEGQP